MAIIQYQYRRDTAANWTGNNVVLAAGEPGYETDTGKLKIGDGTTAWTSLGYAPFAPAGATTQVQFNDAGALNATSGFTFTKSSNTVAVSNLITACTISSNVFSGNSHTTGTYGSATGGATVNVTTLSLGNSSANVVIANNSVSVGSFGAAGGGARIDFNSLEVGNSSANVFVTNSTVTISTYGAAGGGSLLDFASLSIGNSTANVIIANTGITVSTNTVNIGGSTKATNGFSILPNGLKVNWGFLTVNSTTNAVFTNAFTAAYNIVVTPAAAGLVGANTVYVPVLNAGNAQIRSVATSNPATFNCYYVAIGTA